MTKKMTKSKVKNDCGYTKPNPVGKRKLPTPYQIFSDGTTKGTKIFDPSGRQMGMVQSMIIEANAKDSRIWVTLEVLAFPAVFDLSVPTSNVKIKKVSKRKVQHFLGKDK